MGGWGTTENEIKETQFKGVSSSKQKIQRFLGSWLVIHSFQFCGQFFPKHFNQNRRNSLTFYHNNITSLAKCEIFFSTVLLEIWLFRLPNWAKSNYLLDNRILGYKDCFFSIGHGLVPKLCFSLSTDIIQDRQRCH